MSDQLLAEEICALRTEAADSRWLAETLLDPQSIADLERYAAQLEAEAAKLEAKGQDQAQNRARRSSSRTGAPAHSYADRV